MKKVLGIGAAVLCSLVVLFTGCSAPSTPSAPLIVLDKIEITNQPTKIEYHIGDEIDLTGMVVTAIYNDSSTKTLEPTEYTVIGFDSTDYVKDKEITVTYNEKTDTFKINVVFSWFETPKQLPASTGGTYGTEGTYVLFGVWPQDVVPVADVTTLGLETSAEKEARGYMEFVKGNDGNYYVNCEEQRNSSNSAYTKDGTTVGTGRRWFKVMPIKWRVADSAYKDASGSTKGKLLVAENILTANVPYYEDKENNRIIKSKTVYPSNYMHSQIRAYLNGLSYHGTNGDQTQWNSIGFLQTAFGTTAQQIIQTTEVDNSGESTTDFGKNLDWANGKKADGVTDSGYTDYTCENTKDKIFLLSEYEVTKYSKSTEKYNSDGPGNSRIRVTTDFAKANNAYQDTTEGYGGYWWLRSPFYFYSDYARYVYKDGCAYFSHHVNDTGDGVVPALSISF